MNKIKLRKNKTVSNYFDSDCTAYSGIKDVFGNICYLIVNDTLKEIRIKAKNKYYAIQKARYKKLGISYINVPRYLEVIDFTKETVDAIEKKYPNYKHPEWTIW